MRPLLPLVILTLAFSLNACGDTSEATPEADAQGAEQSAETGDATSGEQGQDSTTSDVAEALPEDVGEGSGSEAGDQCAHPCLNEFDQSDKKLCPDPKSDWTCEEGCCVPVFRCAADSDCTEAGFEQGQCTDPALPCLCEPESGVCFSATCSANLQCGEGMICAAGSCVSAPAESEVLLRVLSKQSALVTGQSTTIKIDGYVSSNPDVRFAVDVTWDSDNEDILAVDDSGKVTGGASPGDATLTATHAGGASASITLRNVVPSAESTLTVIALREGTLTPTQGHYALVDSESGESVDSGELPETGVIATQHAANGGFDVHIFAKDHDWVSHLSVSGSHLYVPLKPAMWGSISMSESGELKDETELVGATVVEGAVDMGDYDKAGEVELSLSALPFDAALFDFNLESILGASVKRFFHPDTALPGVDTTETLEMPGGLTFAFAGPAVPTYVLAVPPGTSKLWTLGGRIGIDEVFAFSDDIFEAFDGGSVNFGQIASYLMPFFTEFWSGLSETPELGLDGDSITTVNTTLQTPMALTMAIDVPTLPSLGELGWAATVLAIGGAMTGDELFYPLGLAAAGDTTDETKWPADGEIDGIEETPEPDPLALSVAPLYGELAGPHSSYTTALVALSIRDDGDDPRPEGGSAIFAREPAGEGHKASLPDTSFLPFSLESQWSAETRTVEVETLEGADTVRLLFKGTTGHNWTLWLSGRDTYAVPVPSELVEAMSEDRAEAPLSILISHFDFSAESSLELLRTPGAPTIQELLHEVDRTSFVEL